jgi:peroxiredoxin
MRYGYRALLAAPALLGLALAAPGLATPSKGRLAPDFTGASLDGKKITLSDYRGKNPVVLNFFADFCPPCREEYPHLKALDEKFGARGLRVVSVSMDEDRETASRVPRQNNVRFPVIFDPKNLIAEKYDVQAIPHTVVIGRDGKVLSVMIGLDVEELDRAVAQAMKEAR